MTITDIRPLIGIAATRPLTGSEAEAAFSALFDGAATPAQIGGLLMALRVRGETVDEIAAAEARLAQSGRVLIRKSGTEPLIRVMAEAENETVLREVVDGIVAAVEKAA